jgi:hypothetical protein
VYDEISFADGLDVVNGESAAEPGMARSCELKTIITFIRMKINESKKLS